MRYGSLFSGYGGLDLAVEAVFGAKAAWHAEIEPAPCKVLEARWPGVPNLGDVSKVDWSTVERPEILCGGFPCTDLSAAGRMAGLKPGTRSGLWSEFARGIKALRPELVVIENVRGLLSTVATHPAHQLGFCPGCLGDEPERVVLRALGAVLGDLADLGFDAEWIGLPASAVGAAHPRYRVFALAWPSAHATSGEGRFLDGESSGTAALAADLGRERGWFARDGWARPANGRGNSVAYAGDRSFGDGSWTPGRQSGERPPERREPGAGSSSDRWGGYGPAIARWESVIGRETPAPTFPGKVGQPKLSPFFVEWLMGLPGGWVTGVDGITVNEMLKLLGNGVVPQQAEAGIRELLRRTEGER